MLRYKVEFELVVDDELTYKVLQDKVKIISNPPATILIVGDVKVVVKAHDEPYDLEKGIAMAITKYIGMTRSDMKRLIKKTIVQEPKEKKKKPHYGCLKANYIEF